MARVTGKPAYVAFAIQETAPTAFDVRVTAGAKFSKSDQG